MPAPPCYVAVSFNAIILGLFEPEDGGNIFLRSIGQISGNYAALHPRKFNNFCLDVALRGLFLFYVKEIIKCVEQNRQIFGKRN
jgi:hypothetical protein